MNIFNWINKHSASLKGKKIAVSGSTGGLGKELCFYLAYLKADIILMDRNRDKMNFIENTVKQKYPEVNISKIALDLSDISTVKAAVDKLEFLSPDVIIFNAGAYSIPRKKCDTGLDNVFQINFAAPYYMIRKLLPTLRKNSGRIVAVGSIAHN